MFTELQLISFVTASLIILIIPGPGVAYVVARGLVQGPPAAFASALGLSLGVLVHVAAAVVGLSAIIAGSAILFTIVKLIGAAYLIFLGAALIRSGIEPVNVGSVTRHTWWRLVRDGIVVSATNPKIAIFFMAFLPQFVSGNSAGASSQVIFLGVLYALLALVTDTAYGVFAGNFQKWMINKEITRVWASRAGGSLMIGLGIKAAFARAN